MNKKVPKRQVKTKTKYKILSETLAENINKGKLKPGDRLPSEDKLVSTLGYSLGTVQRALRHLVELGVVERVHGSGTFVAGARAPEEHLRHYRFLNEDGSKLLPIFFITHEITHTNCKGPWADALGHDRAGFVKIERVISVNREFEIFSELYLPASQFSSLLEIQPSELDGVSIRDMLAERFNMQTLDTRETIVCNVFPPRVAKVINMPIGQFGVILTASNTSHRHIPIIWQRAYIPPSDRQMEFLVQHTLNPTLEKRP
jgi:GntR family transcriptional regulator